MTAYCIVRIGTAPESDQVNKALGATCREWSLLPDKAQQEVVAVETSGRSVIHRYSSQESEHLAYEFLHPRIR